ncbi:MAG: isoprenyl transferase [Planctomycetota bacterium]
MSAITEKNLKKTAERLGLKVGQMPRNIAVIMDGNGRWAQKQGKPRVEGHRRGAKIVERTALDCVDIGIESLTLYSFSIENWKRPRIEINALMNLYKEYLIGIRPMMMKNQVRLIHIGRLDNLPSKVTKELAKSIEMTAGNKGMILALALNYSGRAELVDAVKKITLEHKSGRLKSKDINEKCISQHLYAPQLPEPDLLIRTANEMRISNFLLWQISYSEFYVTKTYWPDFTKKDLEKAMLVYVQRERRFGDTKAR